MSVNALYHAKGDFEIAKHLIVYLINQDFTPATPTLFNTSKKTSWRIYLLLFVRSWRL
ncbi:MAG: ribonucleotide reductase N-terminal alpha domain-containing protein, partial [Candidatus Phytoplasma sp. TWB_XP]